MISFLLLFRLIVLGYIENGECDIERIEIEEPETILCDIEMMDEVVEKGNSLDTDSLSVGEINDSLKFHEQYGEEMVAFNTIMPCFFEVSIRVTLTIDRFRFIDEKPIIVLYLDGIEVVREEMEWSGYVSGAILQVVYKTPQNPGLLGEFSWRVELPDILETTNSTSGVFNETSFSASPAGAGYGFNYDIFINASFVDAYSPNVCPKCGEPGVCDFFASSGTYTATIELQMTFVRGSRLANETPVFIVYENGAEIRRENVKWITETIGVGDVLLGASSGISGFVCQQEELFAYHLENFNINDEWGTLTWRVELSSTIRALDPTSGNIGNVTFQSRNHHSGGEIEGYWYQVTLNVERIIGASGNENNNVNNNNAGDGGTSPQTSDTQNVLLFLLLSATSLAVVAHAICKRKASK